MRTSMLCLPVLAAAVLGGCHERSTPTERRGGPAFSLAAAPESVGHDTTGQPSQYTANGASASVNWTSFEWDSSGGGGSMTYGTLTADRVGSVTNEWTVVNWYIYSCNAWCQYSSGFAQVPGVLLTGMGGGDLRLAFDPADYPGYVYFWGDPLGLVDLTWRKNGTSTSRTIGLTTYRYPGYAFRSSGVTEYASATASGMVGQFTIPAFAYANMATNHAVTITFYR